MLLKEHDQSEAQKNTRRRFMLGSQYAKKILQDPIMKEGMASLADNGIDWEYTTQKALTKVSGSSILVQASDLPGNISEHTEVLS